MPSKRSYKLETKVQAVTLKLWTEDATDANDQVMANIITDRLVDLFCGIQALIMATTQWDPVIQVTSPKRYFEHRDRR